MTDKQQIEAKLIQIFTEECVEFIVGGGCIIHFPEIEIENERGESKLIYDLYLELNWGYSPEEEVENFVLDIGGTRTTFTVEDIHNYYIHSHLPSLEIKSADESNKKKLLTKFNKFCLGEDVVYKTLADLNLGFTIDKFIILLNLIDEFVRWESLEGGPFALIEELEIINTQFLKLSIPYTTYPCNIEVLLDSIFRYMGQDKIEKFKFLYDSHETLIPITEEITEIWEQFVIDLNLSTIPTAYKYKKEYFILDSRYEKVLTEINELELTPAFKFKDKVIMQKILFGTNTDLEEKIKEKGVLVPSPFLLQEVLSALAKKLHLYLTKQDTWKLQKQPLLF